MVLTIFANLVNLAKLADLVLAIFGNLVNLANLVLSIFANLVNLANLVLTIFANFIIMEKTRDYILCKEIQEIRAMNKTTSTLFQNQKAVPVDACHDVSDLSYDNYLYIS